MTKLIRVLDVTLSAFGLVLLSPVLFFVLIFGYIDTRSPIFKQERVGKHQTTFVLIKFRTMRLSATSVPTHQASSSDITRFGAFLRKSKLDELPQLFNVLKGEMSIVGPRPCLTSQTELIEARQRRGVFSVLPGITGLAQIKGIDMSVPAILAERDEEMIEKMSIRLYFKYIFKTAVGAGRGDKVKS